MALQELINIATSVEFNRRKSLGVQFTRSEIPKVSETPTRNPWRMNVQVDALIPYANVRAILEGIDTLDRKTAEVITFSNNAKLSWLCAYQGQMSSGQQGSVTVTSFTGNQLVLTNLPSTPAFPSGNYLFKAGDFIKIGANPYAFTVVSDVLRGSGASVTVTTHRPNFISSSLIGQGLSFGNNVSFKMLCINMPTYTVVAGKFIKFNDAFQLYEDTGAA
jgi:hypothetical protein